MVETNNSIASWGSRLWDITSKTWKSIFNFYFWNDDWKSILVKINEPVQFSKVISESKDSILNNMLWKYPIERILSKASILIDDHVNFFSKYPEIYFQYDEWFFWDDWKKIESTVEWKRLAAWYEYSKQFFDNYENLVKEKNLEENTSLWKWIVRWATRWMIMWGLADIISRNWSLAEWITRFASWNLDTAFWSWPRIYKNSKLFIKNKIKNIKSKKEDIWDLNLASENIINFSDNIDPQDKENKLKTDIYAWCSFLGMFLWPVLHFVSDVLPTSPLMSALYSSWYANSDNLSWTIGVLIYNIKTKWMVDWVKETLSDPFHAANLKVILLLFVINLILLSMWLSIVSMVLAALHWTLLNIDSLLVVAALYMYHVGLLKELISQITDKNKLMEIINTIT